MVGTVQELAILELHEKKFVFVLHLDGTLRIWDLASHSRVFSNNMGTMAMAGIVYLSDLFPSYILLYLSFTTLAFTNIKEDCSSLFLQYSCLCEW